MLTVPERLRDLLVFYRDPHDIVNPLSGAVTHHSAGGVPFHHAWEVALARVCDDLPEGDWWRQVFESQRRTWRRAYLRQTPTALDAALALLVADGRLPLVTRERRCWFCGASLEGRRPNVRYCRLEHRKAAWWRRHKSNNGGLPDAFKSAARSSA